MSKPIDEIYILREIDNHNFIVATFTSKRTLTSFIRKWIKDEEVQYIDMWEIVCLKICKRWMHYKMSKASYEESIIPFKDIIGDTLYQRYSYNDEDDEV